VKTVPYAAIRVGGGILAALWCGYVFSREGSVPTVFLGFLTFTAGWFAAQRFGRPIGLSNRRPWLDTVLPIALADRERFLARARRAMRMPVKTLTPARSARRALDLLTAAARVFGGPS